MGLEKQTGVKFTYIPYKGGGEVATQLVGNHVNSTVNNPIDAVTDCPDLYGAVVDDDPRLHPAPGFIVRCRFVRSVG